MSTGSIKHNIEIANPADAERFVEALEEAERISEKGMERLTTEQIADMKEYFSRSKEVKTSSLAMKLSHDGLKLIDTIEAQQQEIDRLKATLADWKYNTKCDADHIAALTADKDEQARKTRQLEEGLRSTLKVLETLNHRGGLGLDIHKWLRDEMQTVNALLGGKEDEK